MPVIALPAFLAACGSSEDTSPVTVEPLRYDYLPPIGLNVASLEIRQDFMPSGARPDVTALDPVPPVAALKTMAQDRLRLYGTSGKAIFAILNASLSKQGDTIDGTMLVTLQLIAGDGRPLGMARAQVTRHQVGITGNLRLALYTFTKAMMDDMNIEFEYQIRHTLKAFLAEPTAPSAPVQATPLDGRQAPPLAPSTLPGSPPMGTLAPPASAQPTPLQPTPLSPPPAGSLPTGTLGTLPIDPYASPTPLR